MWARSTAGRYWAAEAERRGVYGKQATAPNWTPEALAEARRLYEAKGNVAAAHLDDGLAAEGPRPRPSDQPAPPGLPVLASQRPPRPVPPGTERCRRSRGRRADMRAGAPPGKQPPATLPPLRRIAAKTR